jgi:predicted metal-dependent hydrolase
MSITAAFPGVRSSRLPAAVVVQPRKFEFQDLESVPQYWFAGNPIITHMENAFSILIPPGERFFIRSVRNYEDCATDPELQELIRAFVQQEGLHSQAHNEFNDSLKAFGVDVERERAYANRVMSSLEKILPKKMRLGATAFLEHLTAVGAHMLFQEPLICDSMPREMQRFWSWHAAEELEHKAVAFDLFRLAGGGYVLRVLSAISALVLLALPFNRVVRRMMKEDGTKVTAEMRAQARAINRKLAGPQLRMIAQYFKPSFHPWDFDDEKYLKDWYASIEDAS